MEKYILKKFTLDDLPPLVGGRQNLIALPREVALPCFEVPTTAELTCVSDTGLITGVYTPIQDDWHIMTGLDTHFALGPNQIGNDVSAVFGLTTKQPEASLVTALRAFWAGRGFVANPSYVTRQRPAIVVGQLAAGPVEWSARLNLPPGWRLISGGCFIITEADGSNPRTLSWPLAAAEFSKLVNPAGETVVDFDTPQDPFVDAR